MKASYVEVCLKIIRYGTTNRHLKNPVSECDDQ